MGFYNAILTISDPGDEIIISRPYYFNHDMAITMAGCRSVEVPVDANYQLQPEMIAAAINERTRAIVTISPNNPTGAVYPEETLRAINELCRQRGIYHISDEAYESFVYGTGKHFSPAAITGSSGHTISLFSLSKAYGFAGWRIGYMVIPQDLVDPVLKIQDTVQICPTVVSQQAAVGALQAGVPFIESKVGQIITVRSRILDALGELEGLVDRPLSEGAFYILLKIHADLDDTLLVDRLIQHHRVAVIPGSAFGIRSGCYLRIAYGALDETTAGCGVSRLVDGLREQLLTR
jgi:aspartate/methionine/tyrosine aminotransferase